MKPKPVLICFLGMILFGCASPKVMTAWKTDHAIPAIHNKVLVVGIIKNDNDSLRRQIENDGVEYLKELGYTAVSTLVEFGPKGLSGMGQENTYLKLCDAGIDAVITVTLIEKLKQINYLSEKYNTGTNYYFYDRIWNYQKIQADLSEKKPINNISYLWESILFDLGTLQPLCVIQTQSFNAGRETNNGYKYVRQILDKMKKEKILVKQDNTTRTLKPF